MLTTLSFGGVTYCSAFLIKGFGYDAKMAALLNVPCVVVSIAATVAVAWIVRKGFQRWLAIVIANVPAIMGALLLTLLPTNAEWKGGHLAGIYLINTVICDSPTDVN